MSAQRPSSVVFTAAFQVVLGMIWLVRMTEIPSPLFKLLILSIAGGHLYAAFGLYNLSEAGRQRTLQFAIFDLLSVLAAVLNQHVSPFAAVIQLGMPLYILHALNDQKVKNVFS